MTPEEEDEQQLFQDERAHLEDVSRQIAKDEFCRPDQAMLEKLLRLKQRFRINRNRHPANQMQEVHKLIAQTVQRLSSMIKQKLKGSVRLSTVALITCYVNFRDILGELIR